MLLNTLTDRFLSDATFSTGCSDPDEIQAFASAVATAYEAVVAFLDAAPPALRTGEVLVTPESFQECLRLLVPYLDAS